MLLIFAPVFLPVYLHKDALKEVVIQEKKKCFFSNRT
jgi:hypothetical protein